MKMSISRRLTKAIAWITPFAAVLAVWSGVGRAEAPAGRFTVQAGTVYDSQTKLTWQQDVTTGFSGWSKAQSYCSSLSLNGTGWRTPTTDELKSIVDTTRTAPAIDTTAFPGTPSEYFWTSSVLPGAASHAWAVHFGMGFAAHFRLNELFRVRCVR